MSEVFSESLDYSKVKQRAVQSRSYRVKLPPSNATSFQAGETIQFDLPANLSGTYWNSNQCYLKFKFTNNSTLTGPGAATKCSFNKCGAYGLIRRQQISTAGAMISDLDRFNVLADAMLDTDSSQDWRQSTGHVLCGTAPGNKGDTIGSALTSTAFPKEYKERVFCLPLILNPLSQTTPHRFIPLCSLSGIQMRFTLDDAGVALKAHLNSDILAYALSEVEMVMMLTELSPQAQSQIDSMTGGRYDILATSWMRSGATLQAGATGLTANLGFSMSSLERVIIVHRKQQTNAANRAHSYSLSNRATAGITQYSLLINSEQYPARPIVKSAFGAESLAESLIADHSLVDFSKGSNLHSGYEFQAVASTIDGFPSSRYANMIPNDSVIFQDPFDFPTSTGFTAGNLSDLLANDVNNLNNAVGTFVASIELESGVSDGKSSHIYSGISTLASVVQFLGTYTGTDDAGAAFTEGFDVDFFANYTILMSLNMSGTGTWSISV
tara:strand:- start:905 stop:2392 length:1488 start_codon:yes stop_codon:yes gene_type:complete